MINPAEPAVRLLIAGIGNIFQGDDAFGSVVARRLAAQPWPPGVRIIDFGIRGMDLAYALLGEQELTILIDATPRGGTPGTLYTLQLNHDEILAAETGPALMDTHTMHPLAVIRTVATLGERCGPLLLVGCEPGDLGGEEGRMGLTPPVAATISPACDLIHSLATRLLAGEPLVDEQR